MTPIFEKTLLIAAIGMVGIFLFMAIFYLLILALDRLMPYQEENTAADFFEESITKDEER